VFKRNPPYSAQEIADFLVAVDGDIIIKRNKLMQRIVLEKSDKKQQELLRIVDNYDDAELNAIEYLKHMLRRNRQWTERQK
jgi:hypothetical protein